MKKTPWFDGDVTPVRVGVYERHYDRGRAMSHVWFCYWDGSRWGVFAPTAKQAVEYGGVQSPTQNIPWRGLAEEPK